MIRRYKTAFIFWTAVLLSLLSMTAALLLGPLSLALIVPSSLFNLWCVWKSDRGGFVKSKQLRRAHEPARRFNGLQTFTVLLLLMGQIGLGTYALLT